MSTKEDLRGIALSLPDVSETSEFVFKANGVNVAWPWLERIAPKKARVPNYDRFGIRVAGEEHKQAMIATEPDKYFTEPHYDGYPAILVRLEAVNPSDLLDLLTDARDLAMAKRRPRPRGGTS
jgi:hypothetical protein